MIRDPQSLDTPRHGRHTRPVAAQDLSSPFTLHAVDASGQLADPGEPGSTRVHQVEHIAQPWGHEVTFAVLEGRYVGRILHVDAGAVIPLRKHLTNDKTLYLQVGQLSVDHGVDRAQLQTVTMQPTEAIFLPAGLLHRVTAVAASVLLETCTAWPGWRTDVMIDGAPTI